MRKFPFDFDMLERGQYITPKECYAAMNHENGPVEVEWDESGKIRLASQEYSFQLMGLAKRVEHETGIITRQEAGGLRLMEEEPSADYLIGRNRSHMRAIARNVGRVAAHIETKNLSSSTRRRLDNEMRAATMMLAFRRKKIRKLLGGDDGDE